MSGKSSLAAAELAPSKDKLELLLEGRLHDPHSVLGMHTCEKTGGVIIRCLDPQADAVFAQTEFGARVEMTKIDEEGLFAVRFDDKKKHFAYKLEKCYGPVRYTSEDAYCFMPGIGEMDTYLFNAGEHRQIYNFMGAHPKDFGGVKGTLFNVWAPNADRVSIVGNFNNWDGRRNPMRLMGASGIWELFIPGVRAGELYKFEIRAKNGDVFLKLDPYAYRTEMRPKTAAIVCDNGGFQWGDSDWMEARKGRKAHESALNIYEVHLSSWRGPGLRPINHNDENDFHNYREIAVALADYVCDMGYTHVELLPVAEHPFDQSWGYQVTGFYAPTARYGSPEDFAWFVNHLHSRGIGVILDWVPAHFPKDDFSLGRFDGTALYEHLDPRQGEHRDWGTYIFNFGRNEVRNFLLGNALFWLDKFHIDGLRVDAVASMLYLDYSRNDGEWIPNKYGGKENIDAIDFMRKLNELAHQLFPGILMIAEESTAWTGVSRPTYVGGLGFSFKWNMGWMHDTLEYFSLDPVYRSYNQNKLTFSMLYAFSENFILPLSHDEVVHGKCSLLSKMPGDYARKFAGLKALFAYLITHPGKKLMFMGGEFGQWIEWNSKNGLDWSLLDYPSHKSLREALKCLNKLYRDSSPLWEDDFTPNGFEWIDCTDYQQSVFSFIRWNKRRDKPVVVILNLTPVVRHNYRIGVPWGGRWVEVFNSDSQAFGGTNLVNPHIMADQTPCHHRPHGVSLTLPWLSAVILKHESGL